MASGGVGLSAETMARQLYHSLHDKLLVLPDSTQVFPAHGAGSSCGRKLSGETSSTLGEQRRTNYALQPMTEDEFVAAVTEGQPVRPRYFDYDARRNRELHPLLVEEAPPLLDVDSVIAHRDRGALLLDAREPADFAAGHLRGAVNVGLQGRFAEWSGDVLSPERDVILVGDPTVALEATARLGRVGYDRVVGQLDDLGEVFATRPELIETSSRLTIEQLAELRGLETALQLVDIRGPGETAGGTLPGAREIPLATLTDALAGLDRANPVVVYCASGYRSMVAASVLRSVGFADVSDLLGGYAAWEGAGLPTSTRRAAGHARHDAPGQRPGRPSPGRRGRPPPRRAGTRRMGGGARPSGRADADGPGPGTSGRAARRPPDRRGVPLRWPIGGRDRVASRVGFRRRQPRRWDVRVGGRGAACRPRSQRPGSGGRLPPGRRRSRRPPRPPAELRDVDRRSDRRRRDAQRPVLRTEPLRDPVP